MEVAIGMLIIGFAVGMPIGWIIRPLSQSPPSQTTQVQVYEDSWRVVTVNDTTYSFGYFAPNVIIGLTDRYQYVPATAGKIYLVGIEVVVSEVKNEYIILLVKSR